MRRRKATWLGLAAATVVVALAWHGAPTKVAPSVAPSAAAIAADPDAHAREKRAAEVRRRFNEAVVMLHAREHDHAVAALHRVLELAPALPEAHVNMGYAMLGRGQARAARDFFNSAIELRANQANAYYGLALAFEVDRDMPAALGAMRTYLHLSRADDPHRTKARAALWEWEAALAGQRAGNGGAVR